MKLWIDDVRPAPEGDDWDWLTSVNEAKMEIMHCEEMLPIFKKWVELDIKYGEDPSYWKKRIKDSTIELIDIDHDAGDEAYDGGDYIKLLDWLEETGRNYPIRIHSMNPVGRENMRRIIQRNGWTEVL